MAYLFRPASRLKKAKNQDAKLILARIDNFINEAQAEPVRILCGFWEDQQDAISYQELRSAVLAGKMDANVYDEWAQDYSTMVSKQFAPVWENALIAGAGSQPIMSTVLERSAGFRFDTALPGVAEWVSTHSADFVTRCSTQQMDAIKALLARKIVEEHTVDELARFIRPCIGLTASQSKAALKYYDTVKSTLREQHPRMKRETIERKARSAASRYAERAHRFRALTIAQTELASAYNKGADEGIRQAMNEGLLGTMAKVWSTSGDENVCEICAALDGLQVGMDDGFDYKGKSINSVIDVKLLPPAHPRCACAIQYVELSSPVFKPEVPEDPYEGQKLDRELYEQAEADLPEGTPKERVVEMVDSVRTYTEADYTNILAAQTNFGGRFENYSGVLSDEDKEKAIADVKNIEEFLRKAPKYNGDVYRGLGFDVGGPTDFGQYEDFRKMYQKGSVVEADTFTSWTKDEKVLKQIHSARTFYDEECEYSVEVTLRMKNSQFGVDISDYAELKGQQEVLFDKGTALYVRSVKETWKDDEVLQVIIDVEEM